MDNHPAPDTKIFSTNNFGAEVMDEAGGSAGDDRGFVLQCSLQNLFPHHAPLGPLKGKH